MPSRAMSQLIGGSPGAVQAGINASEAYHAKWIDSSPVAMWLMDEGSGVTIADSINSPAQDGTIESTASSCTLGGDTAPDGLDAIVFTADSDDTRINVLSATLTTALGTREEFSMACWAKANAGVWISNHVHGILDFRVDGNNSHRAWKDWSGNKAKWLNEVDNFAYGANPAGAPMNNTNWLLWWLATSNAGNVWRCGCHSVGGASIYDLGETAMTHTGAGAIAKAYLGNDEGANESWWGSLSRAAVWTSYQNIAFFADLATIS